ncbi:MAG: Gfo/Idh/MocA family oxidoreductase [Chloroflexi bacterium]|nr:Gfo/Idh/MocA family oxidoreductase [Chloroflexota bacterium]
MKSKYRIGIAGLDHWYAGLAAAEAAAKHPRAELVAIAHRDRRRLQETAERFGAAAATTGYQEIVERDDVDVVVTAGYVSENAALCREAARRGKHILSVKPIAMSLAEADSIVAAVRAAGVRFISNESMYRVAPTHRQIKRWIDEGRIGRPISAVTALRGVAPRQPWPGEQGDTWWLDPTRTPGGGWIDHSIYHVDALRWLFGSEVVRVGGEIANLKEKALALEDFGVANLVFQGGQVATVEVTWHGPAGGSYNTFQIVGTEGQVVWDMTTSGKLAVYGKFDLPGWVQVNPQRGSGTALDHLIQCLDTGEPLAADEADARANLAICLAFYEAAKRHASIDL